MARAQERIGSGKRPIAMYTDHDSVKTTDIVGALSKIWQESDGSARYIADIADTPVGRTIAALVGTGDDGPQYLRGVSIRGNWIGRTRHERAPGGGLIESGDDLEIGRLDWTSEPGVDLAGVDEFASATTGGENSGEFGISESAPEAVVSTITEQTSSPLREDAASRSPAVAPAVSGDAPAGGAVTEAAAAEAAHVLEDGECTTCLAEARQPMGSRKSGLSGAGGPAR